MPAARLEPYTRLLLLLLWLSALAPTLATHHPHQNPPPEVPAPPQPSSTHSSTSSTTTSSSCPTPPPFSCQWFPLWPYPASCEVPADPAQTTSLQLAAPAAYRFLVEQPPADPALAALLTRGIARLNSSRLWLPTEHRTRGNIVEPHLVQLEGSCLPSPPRITPQTQRPAQTQLVIRVLSSPTTETSSTSSPTAKPPDADESFTLTVSSTGEATLESASVWGALYGLDAFAQLVSFNASTNTHAIHGAPIRIQDRPRFPWRGLMLDTANHYLPLAAVRRTLDLMGLNRLNVLHWHILGSYSFPVRVPAHPPLAGAGAWSSHAVYTEADLRSIQLYAADRGVRVVVEVDLPGHAYAWGLGYPHITVPCPSSISADIGAINSVPFNPANPDTFAVIGDVLDFFAGLLPDPFLHLGGDELQPECWAASQEVRAWMQTMNFTNYVQVQAWFQDKAFAKLASLQRRPIVWQETFVQLQHHYPAPAAVVEVWNNSTVLNMAISAGWDVILANGWYLDRQVPVDNHTSWFWLDTWAFMYQVDPEDDLHSSSRPQTAAGPQTAPGSILGGEANMWTEQVSDGSLDTRVWPRASAIAERLWSPQHVRDTGLAAQRLSLHSCRLANMGLNSGPIWAGFCNRDTGFFNSTAAEPFVPDSCPSSPLQASNGTGPSSHRVDITAAELAAVVIFTFIGGLAVCAGAMAIYRHTHPSRPAAKSADDGMMHVQSTAPRAADEQATPLLSPESAPSPPPSTPAASPASSRLMSLDVFRGFTVALMIFVDMTGASFPPIHHSPWNGVRLADFVMPFFDFIVGVSLAFSLKKIKGKRPALWKATVRFIKLFLLGLFTQGGIDFLNYDLKHIRIMGILQVSPRWRDSETSICLTPPPPLTPKASGSLLLCGGADGDLPAARQAQPAAGGS